MIFKRIFQWISSPHRYLSSGMVSIRKIVLCNIAANETLKEKKNVELFELFVTKRMSFLEFDY